MAAEPRRVIKPTLGFAHYPFNCTLGCGAFWCVDSNMSGGVAQQKTSQGIFASVSGDKVLATRGFCLNKRGRGRARERKTGREKKRKTDLGSKRAREGGGRWRLLSFPGVVLMQPRPWKAEADQTGGSDAAGDGEAEAAAAFAARLIANAQKRKKERKKEKTRRAAFFIIALHPNWESWKTGCCKLAGRLPSPSCVSELVWFPLSFFFFNIYIYTYSN